MSGGRPTDRRRRPTDRRPPSGRRRGGWGRWAPGLAAVVPAALLLIGAGGKAAVQPARGLELRAPLSAFPERIGSHELASAEELTKGELRILRPDDHLLREYRGAAGGFTLFVAWYGRQLGGSSIHSPRNCLPGAGWEPVAHDRVAVPTPYGEGRVNRYLVEHESGARALVYYWYQGRGRVAADEYAVKWHLVRDALLRRRTDEALVRVVFPLGRARGASPASALQAAPALETVTEVARLLAPHLPS